MKTLEELKKDVESDLVHGLEKNIYSAIRQGLKSANVLVFEENLKTIESELIKSKYNYSIVTSSTSKNDPTLNFYEISIKIS